MSPPKRKLHQITSWSDYYGSSLYKGDVDEATGKKTGNHGGSYDGCDDNHDISHQHRPSRDTVIKDTIRGVIEKGSTRITGDGEGEGEVGNDMDSMKKRKRKLKRGMSALYETILPPSPPSSPSLSSLIVINSDNDEDIHDYNNNNNDNDNANGNDSSNANKQSCSEKGQFKMQWMRPHPSLFLQLAHEFKKTKTKNSDNNSLTRRRREDGLHSNVEDQKAETEAEAEAGEIIKGKDKDYASIGDNSCENCTAARASKIINYYNYNNHERRQREINKNQIKERKSAIKESNSYHGRGRRRLRKLRKLDEDSNKDGNGIIKDHTKEKKNGDVHYDHDITTTDYSHFLQYPTLQMDLTELINPHLLSQWVPGGGMEDHHYNNDNSYDSHSSFFGDRYKFNNTVGTGHSQSHSASYEYGYTYALFDDNDNLEGEEEQENGKGSEGNSPHDKENNNYSSIHYSSVIDTIIEYAIRFSKDNEYIHQRKEYRDRGGRGGEPFLFISDPGEDEYLNNRLREIKRHINVNISTKVISKIIKMTQDELIKIMPSYIFMEKIERYKNKCDCGEEVTLKVILTALKLLVLLCPSQSIGIHVVKALYPSLVLCSFSRSGCSGSGSSKEQLREGNKINDDDNDDDHPTDGENETIRFLARLLVSKCQLGKLSKVELRNLFVRQEEERPSAAWNELKMCLSSAFYQYRR